MAIINKISFLSSDQRLTGTWLDAIQNSVRFDGVERNNPEEEPTPEDETAWAVNQRDRLLDWEHNPESNIGRIGWSGRILANDGVNFAPVNTLTINGDYYVWVHGGKYQTSDRRQLEWITQQIRVTPGISQYLWILEGESGINVTSSEPPEKSLSLARLELDSVGEIIKYEDLRPASSVVDFSNRTKSLYFKQGLINRDYVIQPWESVLADTSNGSLYIDLPSDPSDNTKVSIIDSEGYFPNYPVFVRPGGNVSGVTVNGVTDDAFVLTRKFGTYTLVYSVEKNGWFFIEGQESKEYTRGSFISCGGRQLQPDVTSCVSGSIPSVYIDEIDPPRYEIINNLCYLVYPETSALYSNPGLDLSTEGIKAEHMSARCLEDNHRYISGGNSGFNDTEVVNRLFSSSAILQKWEEGIGIALPNSESEILFELTNRTAYALKIGSWFHVQELQSILLLSVRQDSINTWYNQMLSVLHPTLVTEFEEKLEFLV